MTYEDIDNYPEAKTNTGVICPMKLVQKLIEGKWKILILWHLIEKPMRFGELEKALSTTSRGVLTQQLRQLENDGLVHREVFNEVPLKVVYSLTELGESFSDVLNVMREWGELHLDIEINNK